MAKIVATSFTRMELTEDEVIAGSILSPTQKYVLQNRLAELSERKLSLVFTPDAVQTFLQIEAELQGQIRLLQDLMATSDEMVLMQQQLAFQDSGNN